MIKHSYLLLAFLLLTSCSENIIDNQPENIFLQSRAPLEVSTIESGDFRLEEDELTLYKKDHLALSNLITLFINSGSLLTFPQKEEMLKLYDKVSNKYYKLALQIYQQALDDYLKFKVSGNLTTTTNSAEPWADLIKIAKSISFFERRGIQQRLESILGTNPSKEFTEIETLYLANETAERRSNKESYESLEKQYITALKGSPKTQNLVDLKLNLQKAIAIKTWAAFSDEAYPLDWEGEDLEPLPTKLSTNGLAIGNNLRTNLISKAFAINHKDFNAFSFEKTTNLDLFSPGEIILRALFNNTDNLIQSACYKKVEGNNRLFTIDTSLAPDFILTKEWLKTLGVSATHSLYTYEFFGLQKESSTDVYMIAPLKTEGNTYKPGESTLQTPITLDQYTNINLALYKAFVSALIPRPEFKGLFDFLKLEDGFKDDAEFMALFTPTALALSAGVPVDLGTGLSATARRADAGSVDLTSLSANGINGQSIHLGLPVFVQLKGNVSGNKTTDKLTGSVAYRLGNTVIGATQAYANSGTGFETDSNQLETSVVMSHNLGSFFIEGQLGMVSADNVHRAVRGLG